MKGQYIYLSLKKIQFDYIEYLNYNLNYLIIEYTQYKEKDGLSLGYHFGEALSFGAGKIKNLIWYEFENDIQTEIGSSRSLIIYLNLEMVMSYINMEIKEKIKILELLLEKFLNEKNS